MSEKKQEWKRDVSGVVHMAQVVGFGQKNFKLEEMTEKEVAFWEKKGVDFSHFKDSEPAKKTAKELKEERFALRVDKLEELGYQRNNKVFENGESKIEAKKVLDMEDEEFNAFIEELTPEA